MDLAAVQERGESGRAGIGRVERDKVGEGSKKYGFNY
jgi:hypothetical protein